MRAYFYIMIAVSALLGLMEYRYVSLEREMAKKEVENNEAMIAVSKKISEIQTSLNHESALYEKCKNSIEKISTETTVGKILEETKKYERIFNENNSSSVTGSYSY